MGRFFAPTGSVSRRSNRAEPEGKVVELKVWKRRDPAHHAGAERRHRNLVRPCVDQ